MVWRGVGFVMTWHAFAGFLQQLFGEAPLTCLHVIEVWQKAARQRGSEAERGHPVNCLRTSGWFGWTIVCLLLTHVWT